MERMKTARVEYIRNLFLFVLAGTILIMGFMLSDLHRTKKTLAESFISKPLQTISIELIGFFSPMKNVLFTAMAHGSSGYFSIADTASVNHYFGSVLAQHPQITSMGVADTYGYEHDLIKEPSHWQTRTLRYGENDNQCYWGKFSHSLTQQDSAWNTSIQSDPRHRPWYEGAFRNAGAPYWTGPYIFNTKRKAGITVSCVYKDYSVQDSIGVLALDLTLEDLSVFTSSIQISKNGRALVLTSDLERVGYDPGNNEMENLVLTKSRGQAPYFTKAIDILGKQEDSAKRWLPFTYTIDNEVWWAQFQEFRLDEYNNLIIGVVLPEKDMMGNIQRSQKILYVGLGTTLVFMLILIWTHMQLSRTNSLLSKSNKHVKKQNVLIDRKNQDLLDSIEYAKLLQQAMLPTNENLHQLIPHSFVLYLPKDVVSGDFYWIKRKDTRLLFTVADCTGHGVPGAFMSVLGMNILNAVSSFGNECSPSKLLHNMRKQLEREIKSNQNQTKDGMDLGLCCFDNASGQLKFAGALVNLFVLRSKKNAAQLKMFELDATLEVDANFENDTHRMFILKGDRQPIGYVSEALVSVFTEYSLQLLPGDTIYLSSDGLWDQFGGPNNKKFGQRRFRNLLLSIQTLPIDAQKQEIYTTFKEWKGDSLQIDDICLMGITPIPTI